VEQNFRQLRQRCQKTVAKLERGQTGRGQGRKENPVLKKPEREGTGNRVSAGEGGALKRKTIPLTNRKNIPALNNHTEKETKMGNTISGECRVEKKPSSGCDIKTKKPLSRGGVRVTRCRKRCLTTQSKKVSTPCRKEEKTSTF